MYVSVSHPEQSPRRAPSIEQHPTPVGHPSITPAVSTVEYARVEEVNAATTNEVDYTAPRSPEPDQTMVGLFNSFKKISCVDL